MKQPKVIWGAQLAIVLLCALALKQYYSTATANELRWILAPTTLIVELLSDRSFVFESYTGYMSSDHTFVIAVPCAGVNFLITAFVMLTLRRLWNGRFESVSWRFLPVSVLTAYVTTAIANAMRIVIALEIQRRSFEIGGLTGNQLHRLEGIVVYFGFLMLLFVVMERKSSRKMWAFPLVIYYAMTLGVPMLNGSFHGTGFWEHFGFVLVMPLMLLLIALCLVPRSVLCFRSSTGPCGHRSPHPPILVLERSREHFGFVIVMPLILLLIALCLVPRTVPSAVAPGKSGLHE